ncbi:MAG: sugar ABC transporter ATP-binding protein [Clostridiales bacterium]|jgi:ribose transport system ATP-binding protein|nr:sugar ABC transporter ATP-binding protein [Clostridiales bacterium]
MDDIILQAENVSKSFGITKAVQKVSMSFKKGEIRGLIGENGSGKSTFVSMLCGIHTIDEGRFILNGEELRINSQVEANRKGISIIVQEMGTLPGLTVAENIFFGNEDKFIKYGIKNTAAMNQEADRLLEKYGFHHISGDSMIDHYTFEDRKLVEIVRATYFEPLILVIDETTTALSQNGREALYKLMKRFREEGRTVIFISHDLSEVIEHTDTISVLRDGELIDTVESGQVTEDDLKRLMVGRELKSHYYRTDYGEPVSDQVVLNVEGLTVPGEFEDISFKLHKGEILGFGGLSDCGMHELGKAIFGASDNRSGSVTLADGTPINSIPDAIKNNMAYTSKDRDNESVIVYETIRSNICLPSIDNLAERGILHKKKLDQFAQEFADMIQVKMTGINQFVSALSGGNKQKVVLARWLGKDSDIIVLDSPTRGIDVKVKADIYALMYELKKKGKSIIMISEEIQELMGMCDRILIMKDGRINGEILRSPALSEEDFIAKMV